MHLEALRVYVIYFPILVLDTAAYCAADMDLSLPVSRIVRNRGMSL